ncbi:MAG: hypothetical protein ACK5DL_08930 [Burkholderiales bacterium]|jgi:hypothetical protein|nr:hypothetical protein [Betaproteobacteria bacterium]
MSALQRREPPQLTEILQNNEPINRAEGNIAQANLEAANAAEIVAALAVLSA